MTRPVQQRARAIAMTLLVVLTLGMCTIAAARTVKQKKQAARTQFETAEQLREELNGLPDAERTRKAYQRVTDAYRKVYYTAPTSSKADASIVAVAELLAEAGRRFDDEKSLRAAIGQYEFLRKEYPGSKFRVDALFTIAQIYAQDLEDKGKAKQTFEEFLKHYPKSHLVADAKQAIAELNAPNRPAQKKEARKAEEQKEEAKKPEARSPDSKSEDAPTPVAERHGGLPLVTGIRHWSTPDYTRVAIDLEQEVKYEAGRVPLPDRIFFDLHDTKMSSTLKGKTFEVGDGFLRRIRVAQFQKGLTRVVLEVDDVSDYSAFLLPNPYRLIIDIHGRKSSAKQPDTLLAAASQASAEAKITSKPEPKKTVAVKPTLPDAPSATPPHVKTEVKPEPKKTEIASAETPDTPKTAEPKPSAQPSAKKSEVESDESVAQSDAALDSEEMKSTSKPTSEPTVHVVAPRVQEPATVARKPRYPESGGHQARPTANGQRSLIRALGLKIGKIVVDAGHGGHDTGTIGPNGLLEKDLVLDVALRLGKLLEKMGADVVYTRDDDTFVPLETRTAIANKERADLFISIHANSSSDPSARGVETYYLNFTTSADALEVAARENAVSDQSIHELQDLVKKIALKEKIEESREFAGDVQRSLYQGLAAKDKALRNRGIKKAPFIVLIGANMPSILAEISFVSNPDDEKRLQTPEQRQKIAESLYRGVARYISGLSGVKVASSKTSGEGVQ